MDPATRILTVLDRHLSGPDEIRLLGGAALILGYGLRRSTEDVDLVLDQEEAEFLVESRDFGAALEATNQELNWLRVTTLGPMDLVLSKLCRADDRDMDDVRYLIARENLTVEALRDALNRAVVPADFDAVWPGPRARVEALFRSG